MNQLQHLKFKHPFTAVVAGPTSCGKTSYVRALIEKFTSTTTIDKDNISVLWCYGQWQACYNTDIAPEVTIQYFEGIPPQEIIENIKPDIIIIDDLMFEVATDTRVAKLFTIFSHHQNISVIFVTQNITTKGKGIIEINRNTMYIVLFKNTRDCHAVNTLAQQVMRDNKRHFRNSYDDATTRPYGYLLIDCHPTTPREFLLKTNTVGEDGIQSDVYAEKKTDIEKLKALFDVARTSI